MNPMKHIAAVAAATCLSGCTFTRTVIHNVADLDDHAIFANRTVAAAAHPTELPALPATPRFVKAMQVPDGSDATQGLDAYLAQTQTAAFIVVHDGVIVHERYGRGYDERSLLNSFSIAKSMVATLVAIAMAEGRIPSLEATVAEYCPDFAGLPYGAVTLRSLVMMTSGMADRPSILPGRAQYYYGDDLHAVVEGAQPGEAGWRYSEADIQVLGFVLQAAVGKSVSEYLAEKLWQPLGMEAPALWALDREGGVEKTFCCVSARARDFARFGQVFLDGGRANGRQVVPSDWAAHRVVDGVRTPDGYTHRQLWWFPAGVEGDYYAYGHNGQYVYVNPASRTVIVKFSETSHQDPVPMFRAVAASLRSPANLAEIALLAAPRLANR
jgi:CubicO group peptidase (beta-lactamase class C family)